MTPEEKKHLFYILNKKLEIEGIDYSIDKAIEELLELATELKKSQNRLKKRDIGLQLLSPESYEARCIKIRKELADVSLRLAQLRSIFGIDTENYMKIKIETWTKELTIREKKPIPGKGRG